MLPRNTLVKKDAITIVFGFNVLDGGDGSSKILGTYADKSAYQMTPAEILKYGKVSP